MRRRPTGAGGGDRCCHLRHLRNLVVHSTGSAQERISPEKAREFVAMSSAVAWTVEEDLRKFLAKKE